MHNSRRKFIQNTMLLGAGITMPQIMSAADFGLFTRKIKASDQINFGLIGCKGMGWSNMNAHLKYIFKYMKCTSQCTLNTHFKYLKNDM